MQLNKWGPTITQKCSQRICSRASAGGGVISKFWGSAWQGARDARDAGDAGTPGDAGNVGDAGDARDSGTQGTPGTPGVLRPSTVQFWIFGAWVSLGVPPQIRGVWPSVQEGVPSPTRTLCLSDASCRGSEMLWKATVAGGSLGSWDSARSRQVWLHPNHTQKWSPSLEKRPARCRDSKPRAPKFLSNKKTKKSNYPPVPTPDSLKNAQKTTQNTRKQSQGTQPPLTPRRGLDYRGRVPDASP